MERWHGGGAKILSKYNLWALVGFLDPVIEEVRAVIICGYCFWWRFQFKTSRIRLPGLFFFWWSR